MNYGAAKFPAGEGQAAYQLLNGELKDQFLGFISGESVGYVWDRAPAELKISSSQTRRELLEAHRQFYTNAIARKWRETFETETGAMWDKLIPAQSTSSTSFAHALTDWGRKANRDGNGSSYADDLNADCFYARRGATNRL